MLFSINNLSELLLIFNSFSNFGFGVFLDLFQLSFTPISGISLIFLSVVISISIVTILFSVKEALKHAGKWMGAGAAFEGGSEAVSQGIEVIKGAIQSGNNSNGGSGDTANTGGASTQNTGGQATPP